MILDKFFEKIRRTLIAGLPAQARYSHKFFENFICILSIIFTFYISHGSDLAVYGGSSLSCGRQILKTILLQNVIRID